MKSRQAITIQSLPSPNPDPTTAKAHHVGSPPAKFTNPWPSAYKHNLKSIFFHRFGNHPDKNFVPVPTGPNGERSSELVKVRKPDWALEKTSSLRATWIGHASFLVELPVQNGAERGVRVLIDPVFSERTSPVTFFGPKRYTPTPCEVEDLPDVDIICISHNHYDHLDYDTVTKIYARRKGHLHFMTPLGTKAWFLQNVGCRDDEVTDCDWWDASELDVDGIGSVCFTCCPSQHTSARTPFDTEQSLWCSWAINGGGKNLYFAGDTAYQAVEAKEPCAAFVQIGKSLGPFDLAMLPIGLMTPASFMGTVHATPEQSIQIHKEVKSMHSIGMHYGTVRGGISAHYEPVTEPPKRWRIAAEKAGLWRGGGVEGEGEPMDLSSAGVGLCDVGETIAV